MNKHAGSERNLTLVMDLYELTMAYNYFKQGNKDQLVYFDMFYRKNPDNGGFAVFAGLQQLIECIKNLHFSEGDIEYLRSLQKFDEDFLDYLLDFKFTGSIYAMKEGTPVFPNEPLITVKAKFIEAQIIETMLLVTVNHQSLIATKAHRVVQEAKGRPVMEFGSRRSQGYDSATYGARAAYIGGVAGTATVSAGEMFDIPVVGTMAHSFVQSFDNEYEAVQNPDRIAKTLAGIKSRYGSFGVFGNHDVTERLLGGFSVASQAKEMRDPRFEEFAKKAKIRILDDEVMLIDDVFYLVGRKDAQKPGDGTKNRIEPEVILSGLDKAKPIIVLEHQPKQLKELETAGADMQLCGHTHDGQMFPGNLTVKLMWENACGYLKKGNLHSIVTSGVGVWGPAMRVGTDCEICPITIHFQG